MEIRFHYQRYDEGPFYFHQNISWPGSKKWWFWLGPFGISFTKIYREIDKG